MEIFIATDTASVQLFINIFATGIVTFAIPWDQLLNTCVVEVCRLGFEPLCDNHHHHHHQPALSIPRRLF
jgi:hypothetical protein